MGSILWVVFKKVVQFCESKKIQFFESYSKKKSSILWVILQKEEGSFESFSKKINSLSQIQKNVHFFESISKESSISYIEKRFKKKSSILWVIYKEFNSVSHFSTKKISIFWGSFFDTTFNSSNHISEKRRGSIL